MRYCQFCNTKLVENLPVCPLCGKPVPGSVEPQPDPVGRAGAGQGGDLPQPARAGAAWQNNTRMEKTAFLAGGLLTLAVIIVLAVFVARSFPAGASQLLTNAWEFIQARVNSPGAGPDPAEAVVSPTSAPEKQAARCSRSLENCFVDNASMDLFFNGQFAASDHSELIPELDLGQYQTASVDQEWAYIEDQNTRTHVRIYLADMESALYSRPAYVEHFTSQFGVRWKENHTGSLDVIPGGYALPPHTWIFRSPDGVSLMLGTSQNFISVFILSASSGFDQDVVLDGLLRLAGEQVRLLAEGGY